MYQPLLVSQDELRSSSLAQLGGLTQQHGSEKPRSRHCNKVLPPNTSNGEIMVPINHL